MKSKFFTVSQACDSCANINECKQKSELQQELCKMDIIRGGYGDWNRVIDLVLTQDAAQVIVDVIGYYLDRNTEDFVRLPVLQEIRDKLRVEMR